MNAPTLLPLSHEDALTADIDLRIIDIWQEMPSDNEGLTLEVVGALMRACYSKGYVDALGEDIPGLLCSQHGFRVPSRRLT